MPTGQSYPRALRDNEFVRTLELLINESSKTQTDIGGEIGYDNPNIITMFKTGKTRVPLERVVPIAKAIGADPGRLVRLWFNCYMPGALEMMEKLIGGMALDARERNWIIGLRRDFGANLPMYDPTLVRAHAE